MFFNRNGAPGAQDLNRTSKAALLAQANRGTKSKSLRARIADDCRQLESLLNAASMPPVRLSRR